MIVSYPGKTKTTSANYVGQVVDVNFPDKSVEINFAKKQPAASTLFKFPEKRDTDIIPLDYIVRVLDEPAIDNREQLVFKNIQNFGLFLR